MAVTISDLQAKTMLEIQDQLHENNESNKLFAIAHNISAELQDESRIGVDREKIDRLSSLLGSTNEKIDMYEELKKVNNERKMLLREDEYNGISPQPTLEEDQKMLDLYAEIQKIEARELPMIDLNERFEKVIAESAPELTSYPEKVPELLSKEAQEKIEDLRLQIDELAEQKNQILDIGRINHYVGSDAVAYTPEEYKEKVQNELKRRENSPEVLEINKETKDLENKIQEIQSRTSRSAQENQDIHEKGEELTAVIAKNEVIHHEEQKGARVDTDLQVKNKSRSEIRKINKTKAHEEIMDRLTKSVSKLGFDNPDLAVYTRLNRSMMGFQKGMTRQDINGLNQLFQEQAKFGREHRKVLEQDKQFVNTINEKVTLLETTFAQKPTFTPDPNKSAQINALAKNIHENGKFANDIVQEFKKNGVLENDEKNIEFKQSLVSYLESVTKGKDSEHRLDQLLESMKSMGDESKMKGVERVIQQFSKSLQLQR